MIDKHLCMEWLLARAQRFVNRVLSHHQQTVPLFSALENKCLRIIVTDLFLEFEIIFQKDAVWIQKAQSAAHVTIHGRCFQWIHFIETHSPTDFHIEGDLKTAQMLQQTLQTLTVDLQALCCDLWGEIVGKGIYFAAKNTHVGLKAVLNTLLKTSSEFALYESSLAVDVQALQAFAERIHDLRRKLEALEARYHAQALAVPPTDRTLL